MMCVKVLTFLCIQTFLVQNVFSQLNGYGTIGNPGFTNVPTYGSYDPIATVGMAPTTAGIAYNTGANMAPNGAPYIATSANLMPMGTNMAGETLVIPTGMGANMARSIADFGETYGGTGIGDIIVVGEMPVGGSTLVAGQVPILGSVRFAGDVSARGVISATGTCGCGCAFNNPAPTWVPT